MASTYFIRYATSSRGNHADSRGRYTPQVGKPVSPESQPQILQDGVQTNCLVGLGFSQASIQRFVLGLLLHQGP